MQKELLQIFFKLPERGKVKTRLIDRLGDQGAANLTKELAIRIIRELSNKFMTELWYSYDDNKDFLKRFNRAIRSSAEGIGFAK